MREVTEAHYLHERHGLEAVLRPPVGYPTALCWVPRREELVVATREGVLHVVDPVLGTRDVATNIGEAASVDISADRQLFLAVTRDGTWRVGLLASGETVSQVKHSLLGHIDGFFFGKYVVVLGDSVNDRFMHIYLDGEPKARVRLPKGVVAIPDGNKLLLARSTPAGLDVIPFGPKLSLGAVDTTAHVLKRADNHVLGMTPTGIAIWTTAGGAPRSMRMPELTAGDISHDGNTVGLGTRHGAVALSRLDRVDKRAHPDLVKAFDGPVFTAKFSSRGRWFATGGDRLQIWTWED